VNGSGAPGGLQEAAPARPVAGRGFRAAVCSSSKRRKENSTGLHSRRSSSVCGDNQLSPQVRPTLTAVTSRQGAWGGPPLFLGRMQNIAPAKQPCPLLFRRRRGGVGAGLCQAPSSGAGLVSLESMPRQLGEATKELLSEDDFSRSAEKRCPRRKIHQAKQS